MVVKLLMKSYSLVSRVLSNLHYFWSSTATRKHSFLSYSDPIYWKTKCTLAWPRKPGPGYIRSALFIPVLSLSDGTRVELEA